MARLLVRSFGTCVFANGSGSIAKSSPVSIPDLNGASTFSMWLKLLDYSATQFVFGLLNAGATNGTSINVRSGNLRAESTGGTALVFLTQPRIGEWSHIAVTYDGTTTTTYLNGVADTSSNMTHANAVTGVIRLSTYNGGSEPLKGFADEALIFNRALTSTEISSLYVSGTIPSGNVLAWLLNEGTGTSVADGSGTGNAGTLSGIGWSTEVVTVPRTVTP